MTEAREIAQDQVNMQTAEKLGEISSDVKAILKSQSRLFEVYRNHETRITAAESTLGGIKIKIGIIGAVAGAIMTAVIDWLWQTFTKPK